MNKINQYIKVTSLCIFICLFLIGCNSSETVDKTALASIHKIALLSFTGTYAEYNDAAYDHPLIDITYKGFLEGIAEQNIIIFIPTIDIIDNSIYQSIIITDSKQKAYSPIQGLTLIDTKMLSDKSEQLCKSLQVDGLMVVDYSYDFNIRDGAVEYIISRYAKLIVPTNGAIVWGGSVKEINDSSFNGLLLSYDSALGIEIVAKSAALFQGLNESDWIKLSKIAYEHNDMILSTKDAGKILIQSLVNDIISAQK